MYAVLAALVLLVLWPARSPTAAERTCAHEDLERCLEARSLRQFLSFGFVASAAVCGHPLVRSFLLACSVLVRVDRCGEPAWDLEAGACLLFAAGLPGSLATFALFCLCVAVTLC